MSAVAEASWVELGPEEILRPLPEGEETENVWNCIGLDPGGTTGWCVLSVYEIAMWSPDYRILDNIERWAGGQFVGTPRAQVSKIVDLVEAWPDAEVVCEDFTLRQLAGGRELLDPVRITEPVAWWMESGYARQWAYDGDDPQEESVARTLHLQSAELAKSTMTDDRLRDIGMYAPTRGREHMRDALRHALTFARRKKADMEKAWTTGVPLEVRDGV